MKNNNSLDGALARFPRVNVGHLPTPVERMDNLGQDLGLDLYCKRDDCTGIGLGGNKVRQLEFYFGKALAQGADTILITGAVQSNFVRTTAAFAARFGMQCHVQLEERVPGMGPLYHSNGNVLLNDILGAHVHSYPDGEDEEGADKSLNRIASDLKADGKTPFVIPLGAAHPPLGALGYVEAAKEWALQSADFPTIDSILIPSGSALTHVGLLFGLRAIGIETGVTGICVRRNARAQFDRVRARAEDLARLLGIHNPVKEEDIKVFDGALAPGYGRPSSGVDAAIRQTAQREGVLLDPVYSGKTMDGLMRLAATEELAGKRILFWHTGGTPALFAYAS